MNIAIDFDGVLFDTESLFRTTSAIFNLKNNGKEIKNKEALKIQDRYAWDEQTFKKYNDTYTVDVHNSAPIMPYAKKVINAIKPGNKIFAISSRGSLKAEEIEITKNRLKQEGIVFEKLFFNVHDKLSVCKELNIDVMIEDLYENAKAISESGILCLYYRDLVLKFLENEYTVEVRNWGDIAVELNKLGVLDIDKL